MNWLLLVLAFVTVQPKAAEHARTLANKHAVAERKAEVPVPPPPPGASAAVQIPVTGSAVDSAGRKYTFTGVVTLTLEDPPPPPPPPVPMITGVTDTFGGAITQATSGTILLVQGVGLPTTGILRLQVAGRIAPVSVFAPTSVTFTVPPGPPGTTTPITGSIEFFQQVSGTWRLIAKSANPFTILPR